MTPRRSIARENGHFAQRLEADCTPIYKLRSWHQFESSRVREPMFPAHRRIAPVFRAFSQLSFADFQSLQGRKTAKRQFGAFCLWCPKTVSRRAGKEGPETRFACDRDRFACKSSERNAAGARARHFQRATARDARKTQTITATCDKHWFSASPYALMNATPATGDAK